MYNFWKSHLVQPYGKQFTHVQPGLAVYSSYINTSQSKILFSPYACAINIEYETVSSYIFFLVFFFCCCCLLLIMSTSCSYMVMRWTPSTLYSSLIIQVLSNWSCVYCSVYCYCLVSIFMNPFSRYSMSS